jgi:flavin reductase (DIM6/NTAB) family NADH-FMN oxidoreductase RutF
MSVAPAVAGAPVSLSCKVRRVLELGSHDLFLGEVTSILVRDDLLDSAGSLRLEKARLIAYSHGLYQKLGDVLGFFGWSVARPEVFEKRMKSYI